MNTNSAPDFSVIAPVRPVTPVAGATVARFGLRVMLSVTRKRKRPEEKR